MTANTHSYTYNGQTQLYECDLEVTASASDGRMTDYALWTSGEVQFRYAAGGSLTIFLGRQDLINRLGRTGSFPDRPRRGVASRRLETSSIFSSPTARRFPTVRAGVTS